jgi:hypothetical protein
LKPEEEGAEVDDDEEPVEKEAPSRLNEEED